jgi:hypothetical protein
MKLIEPCPPLILSVQVVEHFFILDFPGRFSAFRSPTNKKPQLSPGPEVSDVREVHPFGKRSSQKATPRLHTA